MKLAGSYKGPAETLRASDSIVSMPETPWATKFWISSQYTPVKSDRFARENNAFFNMVRMRTPQGQCIFRPASLSQGSRRSRHRQSIASQSEKLDCV